MFNILLVVPYPKLEETARKVYQSYFQKEDFHVDIRVIRAEEMESTLLNQKYDLLIGRGKSAAILKKIYSDKSVLEIPITGYDIMRSLQAAIGKFNAKKIAVMISSAYNHDEKVLSTRFNIPVSVFDIEEYSSIQAAIEEMISNGYDTVIGGYSVAFEAENKGLSAITVETGEEALMQILHDAVRTMEAILKERERRKIYATITQTSKEGIVYVDNKGRIEIANSKILQMIPREKGLVRGEILKNTYPDFEKMTRQVMQSQQPIYNELQQIKDTTYSVDYVPVIVASKTAGVVITCQSVKKIQQIESQIRKKLSEKGLVANYTFEDIVHQSELMDHTVAIARKYAKVSSNILIVGETGTGKELMAQSIHNASERRNGPFVAINCAALPENLLESELFGYVDGAFTGSRKGGKVGFFEQAHRGTLFLDEISEIPVNFQGKLLRVLQERQVRRIGDDKVIDVDARIIAATNRNLYQMVIDKEFRQDLLYRLDVLKIYIPPLCERKEDILPLFYHFLKEYNHLFGKELGMATKRAGDLITQYRFEGNIRELRNIAERVAVMCEEEEIDEQLMETALYPEDVFASGAGISKENRQGKGFMEDTFDEDSEKQRIIDALQRTGGRKGLAAELLGIDRTTLWRKRKTYNLD